jgi:hypothetical protein
VASTCGHDPAFVRVGPAKFALRALVSPQQLLADDSLAAAGQLDEGAQKALALVGQQQKVRHGARSRVRVMIAK